MNATMEKFGYPDTLVRDYPLWSVQLRPKQATFGALVAICKEPARRFGELSVAAFTELRQVTSDMEAALAQGLECAKLNYLMLMMVDPDVHFHVLPRYPGPREFRGVSFTDPGWPGPPDIGFGTDTDPAMNAAIIDLLQTHWP
ncbi:MAG: HIT family protein [Gammaproteobacteria bacterium]